MAIVNMAVQQGDNSNTFQTLLHDDLNLAPKLLEETSAKRKYQEELYKLLESRKRENSPWIVHV